MNLIDKDYIEINWMYKWLIDELCKRRISHDNMDIFYKMVADWRRMNENIE